MLSLCLVYIDNDDDKELFENIFCAYRKQMVSLALAIVHNSDDAEDVVHDVFLRIATKNMSTIRKIKCNKDLRNYLLKATKNTALNILKQKKQDDISIDTVNEYLLDGKKDYPDDVFLEMVCTRNEYERVVEAIQSMKEKYRDVLYFRYVLEMTASEIAKMFDQTIPTTKKQLVRGKKLLLELLDKEGVE